MAAIMTQQAAAPTVLLLHGFLGQAEDWQPITEGLAIAGMRCIALDLPGHGQTSFHPSGAAGKPVSLASAT